MKTIWISFLHHASGKYGRYMDKVFGFKVYNWNWYNSVVQRYLFDKNAPHNL